MPKKRKISHISFKDSDPALSSLARKKAFAEKKKLKKLWNLTSVKCTLGPFVKDQEIRSEITNCVHWLSLLSIHTHHVLNYHMVKMEGQFGLDSHSVLKAFRATLRALTHTHFRNISREAVELEESAREYVAETGFSLPEKCISGWMQKPLEEAARISATNIKTHYETNLLIYLKRIAIMKIDLVQELSSIKALP